MPSCDCADREHDATYDEDYGMYYHVRSCDDCGYYWEGYYGYPAED